MPTRRRSSDVLPLPFAPLTLTTSPACSRRLTLDSTGRAPRRTTTSTSSQTAALPVTTGAGYCAGYRGGVHTAAVLVTVAVALLAATCQTATGFGFALVGTPLLTTAMPPSQAVIITTLVATPLGWIRFAQEHRSINYPLARRLAISALFGLPVGRYVVAKLNQNGLRLAIGIVVVALALAIALGWKLRKPTRIKDSIAGFVAGILSTSTGTNGPPLVIGLQSHDLSPEVFRATLVGVFTPVGLVTLMIFWHDSKITHTGVFLSAIGLPAMLIGNQLGRRLAPRLTPASFRKLVITLLFISGFSAVAKSIF
jgi:uncharacterized protein